MTTNMGEVSSPELLDDLSTYIITGRTRDPSIALEHARIAEDLGFSRLYLSERYDLKEAGALLGGMAARTRRIGIATGVLAIGSRTPLMTAAMAATLQAAYGHRFVLGLGRGPGPLFEGQGIREGGFRAYEDYFAILRQLFAGETVSYDGPAGRYQAMRTADPVPGPPPPIYASSMGGPRANKLAARIADGLILTTFLTREAVQNAVRDVRSERERLGLDPAAFRIVLPIVTAPECDEEYTLSITAARFVTYVVGMPAFADMWLTRNGWDPERMHRIAEHPQFTNMIHGTADQSFHRDQLMEPARLVPREWIEETCAVGSIENCVRTLQGFRDAGVDELAFYGSTPQENARLVAAWRETKTS